MKGNVFLVLITLTTFLSVQSCFHFEYAFPEISILLPVDVDYHNELLYTTSLLGQVYSHDPFNDNATPDLFFDLNQSQSPGVEFYCTVYYGGEDGLASIEFHPNYPSVPKFFAYHSASATTIQVTEWTVSGGEVDYTSGEVLLDFPRNPQFVETRVGGDLKFDGKGDLYISVGDTANTTASQDPYNFLGKILRITPNLHGPGYFVPNSNPYVHHGGGKSEIYALGMRNPRKMIFPTKNAQLLVGDIGEVWDEINQIQLGDNCGWDYIDGCTEVVPDLPRVDYKSPSYMYTTDYVQAMTLGVYFTRTFEKSELTGLQNTVIYGDLYSGQVFAIPYNDMNKVCGVSAGFIAQAPSAISAIVLVEDTLYVADPFGGFYGAPCFARLVPDS